MSTECFPTEHLNGREIIEPSKQVMISIWMLANMEGYRQISDRFNVTYSSVHRCFMRTCTALQSLSAEKIKWPTGLSVGVSWQIYLNIVITLSPTSQNFS